ncbi:MAG: hypothetical protein OEZ19_00080 [Paracoccaceae bacterium]|nr:hypothetical protein [Paracoccaceae bacterium]
MALPKISLDIDADVGGALDGIERVQGKLDGLAREGTRTGAAMGKSSAFGRGIQNASYQLGDFATQVGAGTNASIALGQQLPQLLGGFGILGAVLGAVVAIGVPLARTLKTMSDNGTELSGVLGTMQPLAESMARAFGSMRDAGIQMAESIINNMDRIISIALVAASVFGVRMVAGFVAARVATFSLAASMTFLRGALIRTGIGALVVGAGELVYQFSRLVQAAGGFGAALVVLKDIAMETFERIGAYITILSTNFQLLINDMQYAWVIGLGNMKTKFGEFMDGIAAIAPEFMNFEGGNAEEAAKAQVDAMAALNDSLFDILAEQSAASDLLAQPLESIQTLKDLLASIKEEGLDLPSLLSGDSGGGEGGGGGGEGGDKKSAWERAIEAIEKVRQAYEGLRSAQRSVWTEAANLIQMFAGKSKVAALAALAIQKGLSIAQIFANSAAAQLRALAELGVVAGTPVAAKIAAYGKIQAALVAAQGLAQAGGIGGGSGPNLGGGGGGGGGSIETQDSARSMQMRSLTIIGDRFNRAQAIQIAEFMNEGTDDGLVVRGR